jgi:putative transposase
VLVERENPMLPVLKQCRLLAVSRSSIYRLPAEVSDEDRAIMALIDRQYLVRPYYGSRRMAACPVEATRPPPSSDPIGLLFD